MLFLLCPFLPLEALPSTTRYVYQNQHRAAASKAPAWTQQPYKQNRYWCAAGTREQSHPLHTRLNPAWTKLQSSRMPSVTTANKEEELRCSPEGNSAATWSSSSFRLSTPSPLLAFSHLSYSKMAILQAHFCLRWLSMIFSLSTSLPSSLAQ